MTITTSGTDITFNDSSVQNTAPADPGFKNRIINGAFNVAQYLTGYGSSGTTQSKYCIDRWIGATSASSGAGTGFSVTNGTVTLPSPQSGVTQSALTIYNTGATGSLVMLAQRIEANNVVDLYNVTVTLSAYIATSVSATVTWAAYYPTTADTWTATGSILPTSGANLITSGTWSSTATLTRFTASFNVGTNASTKGLMIAISSPLTGTNTMTVTGVQLEKAPTATVFAYRPYGAELRLCQRYYCQMYTDMQSAAAGSMLVRQRFPVTMRATPSVSAISAGTTSNCTVSNATGNVRADGAYFQISASVGSGYVLDYLYSASAEL